MRAVLAGVLAGVLVNVAVAAPPPPGSEDEALMAPVKDWIVNQHSAAGGWCCNLSDGRPLFEREWRAVEGGWEVFISRRHWPDAPASGVWIRVAQDKKTAPSPIGMPIVWWVGSGNGGGAGVGGRGTVYCFAPVGGF